jgi:mono/diheme cytochrome c family protein
VRSLTLVAVLVSAVWLLGCGGGEGERPAAESQEAQATPEAGEPSEAAESPVDESLAERGESLIQAKGCTACHTVGGGRLVGPDLAGVTERRSDAFIIGMILNPDSMLANDETAKQLLAEYFTPMSNQGVTRDDARALLAYLKRSESQ